MIYQFKKSIEYAYYADVEADSLEEAKEKLGDAKWNDDDGGEGYVSNKRIVVYESYDDIENCEDPIEELDDEDWIG